MSILCPGGRKREFKSTFLSAAAAVVVVFEGGGDVLVPLVCSIGSMEVEDTSSLPTRSNGSGIEYHSCRGVRECVARR
jgi:hypothetical protein